MVSSVFFLCSSLLFSGVVFAENELQATKEVAPIETDPVLIQAGKQAMIASINVFNDVMDGKNITNALIERGIEALSHVDGAIPEYGKGFLENVKKYKEGEPIEKIASNITVAIRNKWQGKVKSIDDIYNEVGQESIRKFVEGVTKVVKNAISDIIKRRGKKTPP